MIVFVIRKPVNVNVALTSLVAHAIAVNAAIGISTPKKDVRSARATQMEVRTTLVIRTQASVYVSRASR